MANVTAGLARRLLLFVLIVHALSHAFAKGGRGDKEHKGTVKTIKSADGSVIDCVDIYKQPAFDHPLLKNHKIQMQPSSYPNEMRQNINESQVELVQTWHKNGECPEGTIPIRRTPNSSINTKFPRKMNASAIFVSKMDDINGAGFGPPGHEYAQVSNHGRFHGARATINVWNPTVENWIEASLSKVWVYTARGDNFNSVEAGWIVYPGGYGDTQTRFFLYWTADGYKKTGCYDLRCPGFVQVNRNFAIGELAQPVSKYNSGQFDVFVSIHKDTRGGNWWVQIGSKKIGYWPSSLFNGLAYHATWAAWGGEIVNWRTQGHHTSTQMGSGHFAWEDFGKASYFRRFRVMDLSQNWIFPSKLIPLTTNPSCYNLRTGTSDDPNYDNHFFYGGPGYSHNCN